jgi:hypothetical protein
MSKATEDDRRSIKPHISTWNLKEHERRAFEQRESLPGWKLADKSRRLLADVSRQLNDSHPELAVDGPDELRPFANEYAAIEAAGIAVRAAGAVLAQVSCGYVVEAAAGLRRIIEARLHLRTILEDPGGSYAVRFIEGKGSTLGTLTKRHGSKQEVEALHQLSHADSRGLRLLSDPDRASKAGALTYGKFHVFPFVDPDMAHSMLYVLSREMVGAGRAVCEVFGAELEVTPWVLNELVRLDGLAAREAAREVSDGPVVA